MDYARFSFPWGVRYACWSCSATAAPLVSVIRARTCGRSWAGREEALLYFGDVAEELLFGSDKAVITRDLRLEDDALIRNAEFLRFARHWGFTPRACRPGRRRRTRHVRRSR